MNTTADTHEAVMQAEDLPGLPLAESRELQSPWMDYKQAAAYLGVSESQVQELSGPHTSGDDALPFHRLVPGGAKRFHTGELDAWLLAR